MCHDDRQCRRILGDPDLHEMLQWAIPIDDALQLLGIRWARFTIEWIGIERHKQPDIIGFDDAIRPGPCGNEGLTSRRSAK